MKVKLLKLLISIFLVFVPFYTTLAAAEVIPPIDIKDLKSGKRILNVGYIRNYIPFYFNDGSHPKGLEPDILHKVIRKINIKNIHYKAYGSYIELDKALLSGKTDMSACDYWNLPMKPKSIETTRSYYSRGGMSIAYIKSRNSFQAIKDLKGHVIGIARIEGDIIPMLKKKYFSQSTVRLYENYDALFKALRANKIAVAYVPYSLYLYDKKQNVSEDMQVLIIKKYPSVYALRAEDKSLIKELNQAITELKKDGTLTSIANSWVGN